MGLILGDPEEDTLKEMVTMTFAYLPCFLEFIILFIHPELFSNSA